MLPVGGGGGMVMGSRKKWKLESDVWFHFVRYRFIQVVLVHRMIVVAEPPPVLALCSSALFLVRFGTINERTPAGL